MTPKNTKVRIVCISDTHNKAPGEGYTLPDGDVLIHAGDLTNEGSYHELQRAAEWLEKADFAAKMVVAGNHDLSLDASPKYNQTLFDERSRALMSSIPGVTYLEHAAAEIVLPDKDVRFRVFGSPRSLLGSEGGPYTAFQYDAGDSSTVWDDVSDDTDVLITHTPPMGLLDISRNVREGGCGLLEMVLGRIKPAVHVFGHCHDDRGAGVVEWDDDGCAKEVRNWQDPGAGSKKLSLFDLTGKKGGKKLERGRETAIVNASMVSRDRETGKRKFEKAIVVDVVL